jgi:dipeptidyl-peptidase-3
VRRSRRPHAQPADDRGLVDGEHEAIDVRTRDGKTYYVMTDPVAYRDSVGGCWPKSSIKAKRRGRDSSSNGMACTSIEAARRSDRPRGHCTCRHTRFVMPKLTVRDGASGRWPRWDLYPQDLTAQMLEFSAATRSLRQ